MVIVRPLLGWGQGWARRDVRTIAALGLVAALAATACALALTRPGAMTTSGRLTSPASSQSASSGLRAVPPGFRLIGQGHVAVQVPAESSDAALACATSMTSTAVVGRPALGAACWPDTMWTAGAALVQLTATAPPGLGRHTSSGSLGGVRVIRGEVRCGQQVRCHGALWVPAERVGVQVYATTTAEVEKLLEEVRIVPDLVGVPSMDDARRRAEEAMRLLGPFEAVSPLEAVPREAWLTAQARREFEAALARLGLRARELDNRIHGSGSAFTVAPAPGTMLPPGSVVTITWGNGAGR